MSYSMEDTVDLRDVAGDADVSWALGPSWVREAELRELEDLGALVPGAWRVPLAHEGVPAPKPEETVVFLAYFEAGLRLPCVELVRDILALYSMELPMLTPGAVVHLSAFEWLLRMNDASGTGRSFAALHNAMYCPELRKVCYSGGEVGEAHLMYGCVAFAPKTAEAFPATAGPGDWGEWTRGWFYCAVPEGLRSGGGRVVLRSDPVPAPGPAEVGALLLAALSAKRQGVRELVEEFLMLGIAPLGQDWTPLVGEVVDGIRLVASSASLGTC